MSYKRILVTLDSTAVAECALEPALKAAGPETHLHLLSVIDVLKGSHTEEFDLSQATDRRLEYLNSVRDALRSRGYQVDSEVCWGTITQKILEYAKKSELLVIATHGRAGLSRITGGSVTEAVLHETPCPLLIVRAA